MLFQIYWIHMDVFEVFVHLLILPNNFVHSSGFSPASLRSEACFDVLMDLPDMDQLKQRLLPGCTTASKNRWQILDHDRSRRKLYFSPPERRLCVPGRRFGIYRFRIFIFPAVFSHPFIEEQLASFCPISPNALRSPLHCNALQCNAPSTVMLWTAQFENGIYNNTVCNLCLH